MKLPQFGWSIFDIIRTCQGWTVRRSILMLTLASKSETNNTAFSILIQAGHLQDSHQIYAF